MSRHQRSLLTRLGLFTAGIAVAVVGGGLIGTALHVANVERMHQIWGDEEPDRA